MTMIKVLHAVVPLDGLILWHSTCNSNSRGSLSAAKSKSKAWKGIWPHCNTIEYYLHLYLMSKLGVM